jgi:hypothetical protein
MSLGNSSMNATLEPPVAIALPPLASPEPVRADVPRRIGLIMAEVLARHGLDEAAAATAAPAPRCSA